MDLRIFLAVITVLLGAAAMVVFWLRARFIWQGITHGKKLDRFENPGSRLSFAAQQVLGHIRLRQQRFAGLIHGCIFFGFLVLLLDVLETLGQLISPSFNLGPVDGLIDVFVLVVILGLILALVNRLIVKPKRFHGSNETDAFIILGIIALIMVGIIIRDAYYPLAAREGLLGVAFTAAGGHFLGGILSGLVSLPGWSSPTAAAIGYAMGYLLDIATIMVFFAYLPYSKHFHVFAAVPNIYLHKTRPHGELLPAAPEDTMAVKAYRDFTWKDILDLYTCTECGRCQEACPANASGAPLSPKHVIMELRDELTHRFLGTGKADPEDAPPLAGEVVEADALWSCTTCGACQEVCPVFIEHANKISPLRAALLEEGEAGDAGAQKALVSLDRQGNSFGQPSRKRAAWVSGLAFPVPDARKEPVDLLWFVGDYASYDPRAQENTRALAKVLHRAGVKFGLLYEGEVNSGNDALRMGEYGLFETLAGKNMAAMEKAEFNRVFTTDPHSLNALRNEYKKLGFDRPVLHYTELLLELVESRRLELRPLGIRATYHDPCYLGRWNRVFEQPRELLRRCGVELVEMPRHGRFSFCCGAGGGRIWMSETGSGERPADQRVKEALGLSGVTHLTVACPKDVAMFASSLSALGEEKGLRVVDVAILVEAASRSGEEETVAN